MVLHTDEPHPHVHMVIKAISEHGERLNIRKETLRRWRAEFARHLRALGVAANATERAVRGENRISKLDGIYRAMRRGESSHMARRVLGVAAGLAHGRVACEPGKSAMMKTRSAVTHGWLRVCRLLSEHDEPALADSVRRFVDCLPPTLSEREMIAAQLQRRLTGQQTRSGVREPGH